MTQPRRRRTLTGVALLIGVALTSTACLNQGPAASSDGQGEVGGNLQVAWWGGESRNAKTNAVIEQFGEAFPEVTTETQSADYAQYFNRLNVQASSRSLPCVVQMQDRQVNDYVKRQTLQPLDDMVASGAIDTSMIPEAVLDGGRGSDGKLYFIPYGIAWDALMVNTTLAEEAGAEAPPETWDWEQFFEYVRSAQEGLPEGTYAVAAGGEEQNAFYAWAVGQGIEVFDAEGKLGFTEDQLKEYWSMWLELQEEGVALPPDMSAEEPPGADQGYLATGQVMVGVLPGNSLYVAQQTLEGRDGGQLQAARYPDGPAGIGNILVASGFGVSTNCENVPSAAAFIDFFTNDVEAGVAFAADNGAPTNTAVLDALTAEDSELPDLKRDELEQYRAISEDNPPKVNYPPGFNAVFQQAFTRNYNEVAFGRLTLDEAVDAFFTETNASLG